MMKIAKAAFIALLCASAVSTIAHTKERPCDADVLKYCADDLKGPAEVGKCLKEHEADLTDTCKAVLTQMNEHFAKKMQDNGGACAEDAKTLCADIKPGGGAIVRCLMGQKEKLSEECAASMKKDMPCRADTEKFCPGLKPGPQSMACMKEHTKELSEGCRANIEKMTKAGEKMRAGMEKKMAACKDDAKKLCADVKTGGGKLLGCLREHEAELSDDCKTALPMRHMGKGPVDGEQQPPQDAPKTDAK